MIGKDNCRLGRGQIVGVQNGDVPVEEVVQVRQDNLDDWIEAGHGEINDLRRI